MSPHGDTINVARHDADQELSRLFKNVPIVNSIEMYPCWVEVIVGMRTEAKPCFLGRSGSAYSNERVRRPGLHVLIALSPGMVFLGLPHPLHAGGRRSCLSWLWLWFKQLRKSDSLAAIVQLNGSVFPLADEGLAFGRTIASVSGLQL